MQSGLRLHARPEVDLATEEYPRALLHMAAIAVVVTRCSSDSFSGDQDGIVRDGRKRRRQENFRHLLCGERKRPTAGLVGIYRPSCGVLGGAPLGISSVYNCMDITGKRTWSEKCVRED